MKNLLTLLIAVIVTLTSCADKPPSVRVQNLRDNKANVQIKQSNGNTINHNDVQTGQTTNYQDVNPGVMTVTAELPSEQVDPDEARFVATDNNNYTIVILRGDPPTIRIDQQSK